MKKETKERPIAKEKSTKIKKDSVNESITKGKFFDKAGKEVFLKDIITKDECWLLKKENKWILTHNAIKKIAVLAGISKNFDVDESQTITPDYRNELEHVVRVTIHCNAKGKNGGCVHSDEKDLTMTGESNRINTPNRGRGYLRKMAEKRAFDIAVLEHLDLYSSIFSEEEAADFEKTKEPEVTPGTKEFEEVTTEINAILNAEDLAVLKKVGRKIKKGVEINKYTKEQIKYLKSLYEKEYGKRNAEF